MTDLIHKQLLIDLALAEKAVAIFVKSVEKSKLLLNRVPTKALSDDERETLESLTTRYARALDFLTQKLLRTIDKIELTDDGSVLDRVNRFKKRGVLREEVNYGILKDLRNQIAHEYIIDESDQVVHDVLKYSNLIVEMFNNAKSYCQNRGFTKNC